MYNSKDYQSINRYMRIIRGITNKLQKYCKDMDTLNKINQKVNNLNEINLGEIQDLEKIKTELEEFLSELKTLEKKWIPKPFWE